MQQPLLRPGSGWAAVQETELPAIGSASDSAYDDKVMARWDVVPFQEVIGEMKIGVVAFHANGIERVDFSVNNGPWVSAREMTYNDQSGVWEFTARLRSADFSAGESIEVRAIAYPAVAGIPRVLAGPKEHEITNGEASLYLNTALPRHTARYVSVQGSDTIGDGTRAHPFRTIRRALNSLSMPADDGADVVLVDQDPTGWVIEGRNFSNIYSVNFIPNHRWITIRPDVGQPPQRLVSPDEHYVNTGIQRTKFQDVILDFRTIYQIGNPANSNAVPGAMQAYWQERVIWDGPGYEIERTIPILGVESGVAFYTTNSTVRNLYMGFVQHTLVRGCHDEDVSGDHYTNTKLVVNSTVNHSGMCDSCYFHPDLFQYFANPYYLGVYDDQQGNHHGATWNGTQRLLHANPELQDPLSNYTLQAGDRLFVTSGTGVVPGVYRIVEIVDGSTLRLADSITGNGPPVDLNVGDIFAIMSGTVENIIVYGVQASNIVDMQTWHYDYGLHRDYAFVNIAVENVTQGSTANGIGYLGSHNFLFLNISDPRKPTFFANQIDDIRFINSVFEFLWVDPGQGLPEGMSADSCFLNQLPHDNFQNYFNSNFGTTYVDGNPIGRDGTGAVQVHFDGPTPSGSFQHTGIGASTLEESGKILPGFGSWQTFQGHLPRRGAYDFRAP